jgi:3-demethoxyubiquinol 3-hydroxylase
MTDTPPKPVNARPARLPGDTATRIDRVLRVDHAGEYGAARIYAGQLAVMGKHHRDSGLIQHMADQEKRHLDTFDRLLTTHKVRPTVLGPVWHVAGFALGAATALMGPRAAMACTSAVEEVIDGHYAEQHAALKDSQPDLAAIIEDFRQDEVQHRETAEAHGAKEVPGFPVMRAIIRAGCRTAIAVSERI